MIGKGEPPNLVDTLPFPSDGDAIDLSNLNTPRFLVTVDTEEEFDWSGPFSRDRHALTHLPGVSRFQALCETRNVKPVYLVDYPVVTDAYGIEMFSELAARGVAEIGLQLHPWVTPPFKEELGGRNSYACNLPAALERAKLKSLYDVVVEKLKVRPDCYRAGRYGAGENTPAILAELGVRVDTSVRALFDYSGQGGPNYARYRLDPYWVKPRELLELPVTSVFGGLARTFGTALFDRVFQTEAMRAFLARGKLLERIALTPEGIPVEKAVAAIDIAIELKVPVLTFSFHSPSLAEGHTPYVRNPDDLEYFYRWWEIVFDHLEAKKVAPTCMSEIITAAFC